MTFHDYIETAERDLKAGNFKGAENALHHAWNLAMQDRAPHRRNLVTRLRRRVKALKALDE